MARGVCSSCGKPVYVSRSSRPEPTCHPCRREAWGLRPDEKVADLIRARRKPPSRRSHCRRCDAPVPEDRRAYCSAECARKRSRNSPKRSTGSRGYGSRHQMLRAELLPSAYGKPCHLCGEEMTADQELHLDHTEDRTGYRGFAHGLCNSADGLQRAQEALRKKRLAAGRPRVRDA